MKAEIKETNNNQTIDPTENDKLADLQVADEHAAEVKGGILIGMLLPAIQKVR